MFMKIILSITVALTLVVAVKPDEPSFVHSQFLIPCNYTGVPSCLDCEKRLICTRIGGIVLPCWLPGRNCVEDGRCSSEPSDECADPKPTPPPPPPPTTQSNTEVPTSTGSPTSTTTEGSTITGSPTSTGSSSTGAASTTTEWSSSSTTANPPMIAN